MSELQEGLAEQIASIKRLNAAEKYATTVRTNELPEIENRLASLSATNWVVVSYSNNETENETNHILRGISEKCDSHVLNCTFRIYTSKYRPAIVCLVLQERPEMFEFTLTCDHEENFVWKDKDRDATVFKIRLFDVFKAAITHLEQLRQP